MAYSAGIPPDPTETVYYFYGIDEQGPMADRKTNNNNIVPEININIDEYTMNSMKVNPLAMMETMQ